MEDDEPKCGFSAKIYRILGGSGHIEKNGGKRQVPFLSSFHWFCFQKALTQGCWITQKLKIDQGPPMGHILAEISQIVIVIVIYFFHIIRKLQMLRINT